ncbi:MAG: glycoside hydrolase family 18 protein [Kiritimatiellia bacterium]
MKTKPPATSRRLANSPRRWAVWIGLALAAGWLAVPAQAQIVAGYYPEWRRWSYPPSAIPLEHLTHVIYCFAFPNADGTLSFPQGFFDPVPDLEKRVHAAGKKLLISVGGALDSEGFAPMAANATTRARFVSQLTGLCLSNRFDGVDLDWEFPASAAEGTNLTQLVREIRAHWNQVAPHLMLTLAIGPTDWSAKYFDVAALHPLLDWIDVMTYCYYGAWSGRAGHNAPLYTDPADPLKAGSTDQSIREYFHGKRGVPLEKMALGIPFYGLTYTGTTQLYAVASGGTPTFYRNVVGLDYAYRWDGVSQVPYLVSPLNGGTLVPFDDPASVRLKAQYAKSMGLAGVAIWELSQDAVAVGNQPLLASIGTEMLVAEPPPPPPTEPTDDFATSQSAGAGTVSGSLAALTKDDNVYQSIKEQLSKGAAKKAYSYLAHMWAFNVTGGQTVTFHVQAHRTSSADNDTFTFSYSTNAVAYVAMLTVTKTWDNNAVQTYPLPAHLKGKVYVRVQDSNRSAGKNVLDTLSVDQLFIRSSP